MSIEDAVLKGMPKGSGIRAATAVTVTCLFTACLLLIIDYQIKKQAVEMLNEARRIVNEWKVIRDAWQEEYGTPGSANPDAGLVPGLPSTVLDRKLPGMETGHVPDGTPPAAKRRAAPRKPVASRGNSGTGVSGSGNEVGS